nr:hypothetical protein [Tanacetum cinerariifolium]
MQEKLKLSKTQGASTPVEVKRMQNIPYALAVGSIMHAVRCTRPDVAFAQNITSRFQQNLDADDLKYLTVYVFVLNGGTVDWKSTKQSIFATLSVEAEYIAASDAFKEAVWVRKFISGLSVVPIIEEPIKIYRDNTRSITIAKESGITKGARHYHAKVHYLREVIEFGNIKIEKVHTYDNLDDPFTKAFPFPKHLDHTMNIRMLSASCFIDPKKKNFYGQKITQGPKILPGHGTSSDSIPVNNKANIEAQVNARVESRLEDVREGMRAEMRQMFNDQQKATSSN